MNDCTLEFHPGNDMAVTFDRTVDVDDEYYTSGSGTWSLTDEDGTEVTGGSGTVEFVTGSTTGKFRLVVPKTVTVLLTTDAEYTLTVDLTSGSDDARWEFPVLATRRTRTRDGSCSNLC